MSCNLLKYFYFICALQCLSLHIVERCFASFVRAALSLHRRLVAMFCNDIHELNLPLALFAFPLTKRSAKSLCGTCRFEKESPQPKQIIHRHSNTPENSRNYEHHESIKSENPENTKKRNFENLDIVTLTKSRKCAG